MSSSTERNIAKRTRGAPGPACHGPLQASLAVILASRSSGVQGDEEQNESIAQYDGCHRQSQQECFGAARSLPLALTAPSNDC